MLIQNANKNIDRVVYNDTTYKAVQGIADPPNDVAAILLEYPDWSTVTDVVDDFIISQLSTVDTDTKDTKATK